MTEHRTESVDSRAASAARDLQRVAAERRRPAFEPGRPVDLDRPVPLAVRSRRPALAAVAAAVVLLGGVVTWAATRPDRGGDAPAAQTVDGPRPHVATTLEGDMALAGAQESDGSPAAEQPMGPMAVYGPVPDDPRVGVAVVDGAEDLDGARRIDLDGRVAYLLDMDDGGFAERWLVVEDGPEAVMVVAPTLDEAGLLEAGAATTVDGSGQASLDLDRLGRPDWRRLGVEPDPVTVLSPLALGRDGDSAGYHTIYARGGEEDGASIFLSTVGGTDIRAQVHRLLSTDPEVVSVAGRPAVLVSRPAVVIEGDGWVTDLPATLTLAWVSRPGEIVRMVGVNVDRGELLTAAEGVRPAGAAEWRDLLERSRLGDFRTALFGEDQQSVEVGRGRFGDGTAWVLRAVTTESPEGEVGPAEPDLSVAVDLEDWGGSSSSSSGTASGAPTATGLFATATVDGDGRHFAAGLIGDGVATVQLRRADGSVASQAQMVAGEGYRGWVGELADDPTTVVALDAQGAEVDSIDLGELDANVSPGEPASSGPTQSTVVADDGPGGG